MNELISFRTFCGVATVCAFLASQSLGSNISIIADVIDAMTEPESSMAILFSPQHVVEKGSVTRHLNVAATQWTCPRSGRCYDRFVRYVTQRPDEYPRPALVLVPQHTTVPSHVLQEIPRFQKYHSNVDWIFSVKEHADLLNKLRNDSCQVITVTENGISAPLDGYRSCQERKDFGDARVLLSKDAPREGSYPKHARLYYAFYDMPGNYCGMSHGNAVEAAMQAYRTLNNSLVYRCNNDGVDHSVLSEKHVDVILGERDVHCPDHCFVYRYAMHPPRYHYFLVRRSTPKPPSFVNTWLWFFLIAFLLLAPFTAVFILALHLRRRFRPEDTFCASDIFVFFVSTFLGRCPPPGNVFRAMSSRLLLVSWMLGMVFLGSIVQTSITASRSVPIYSAEIKSMPDLLARLDDGAIVPCMSESLAVRIKNSPSQVPYIQTFSRALDRCGNSCALDHHYWNECIARIKSGTHAGVFGYTPFSVSIALNQGLEPGEDIFMLRLRVSAAHGRYPLRHQHRRLLLALDESGLLSFIENRRSPMKRENIHRSFGLPLRDYMLLYVAGCTLSTFVFAVEVYRHRACGARGANIHVESSSCDIINLNGDWKTGVQKMHVRSRRRTFRRRIVVHETLLRIEQNKHFDNTA